MLRSTWLPLRVPRETNSPCAVRNTNSLANTSALVWQFPSRGEDAGEGEEEEEEEVPGKLGLGRNLVWAGVGGG